MSLVHARRLNRLLVLAIPLAALLIADIALAQSELLSRENVRAFRLAHPCPMTRLNRNACPGWTVALVTPKCAGGTDDPANMQWLTDTDASAKAEGEAKQCPPAPAPPGR